MYAIIQDGGRQYQVEEGQELALDYRDASSGQELKLERVLAVSTDQGLQLGTPTVAGASVTAEVVGVALGEKLTVQKLRRRKTYRRKAGHRQLHTLVKIRQIDSGLPAPPKTQPEPSDVDAPETETTDESPGDTGAQEAEATDQNPDASSPESS
jgi:large subunit ribosomal protein L21